MVNKKDNKKEFEMYRKHLIRECQRLTSYIDLYKYFHEKTRDRLDELNISPCFFKITIDALFTGIIILTYNLFYEKSERGFLNFLTFIENNFDLFKTTELKRRGNYSDSLWAAIKSEDITDVTIKSHRDKIKSTISFNAIRLRRDKLYAHFDKKYFFDKGQLTKDAPMAFHDLENIKAIMKEIIDKYSASYDGNVCDLTYGNSYDIDNVFNILHEYNIKIKSMQIQSV